MIKTTCKKAGTPKACPKKVTELFYVTHPKTPKALMGPFLTEVDAECGRVVMRSSDALVTACLIDLNRPGFPRHSPGSLRNAFQTLPVTADC